MNELKLPEPDTHCLDDEGGRPIDVWSYSPEMVRLIVAADRALREQAQPVAWIATAKTLPPDETPVILLRKGEVAIGQRVWEHPGHEDNFSSFWVWADVNDHWHDDQGEATVTHWMPIPSTAAPQAQPERKPLSETDLLGLRWDAKCRWNSQADAYNAWDELGQDEQDLLVGREVERFHGIEE